MLLDFGGAMYPHNQNSSNANDLTMTILPSTSKFSSTHPIHAWIFFARILIFIYILFFGIKVLIEL